jgi:hypothetical protein
MDESDVERILRERISVLENQRAVAASYIRTGDPAMALEIMTRPERVPEPWPALPIIPPIKTKLASIAPAAPGAGEGV